MEISIIKLKDTIDNLLEWVRQDLITNQSTPTQSWLYDTFNDITIGSINFYEQLSKEISKEDNYKDKIETRLMFEKERANLPTFHIHYPSEDGKNSNVLNTGFEQLVEGDYYSRRFNGSYDIIVTAGNSIECVMLYEFMEALLIAAADTLAYQFEVFNFAGKQLQANQEIIPHLTFYRAITITLLSNKRVRSIVASNNITDINFTSDYTDVDSDMIDEK